jgi:TPR repeat protein
VNTSKASSELEPSTQVQGAELPGAVATDMRADQSMEAGKVQLAAALAYLNAGNGPHDSSKAVKQLWAAVGNGNSDAEIILAGLYVRGDGVAKSCEQGRVLLQAAMKSGNAQAKMKLAELNAQGCS